VPSFTRFVLLGRQKFLRSIADANAFWNKIPALGRPKGQIHRWTPQKRIHALE